VFDKILQTARKELKKTGKNYDLEDVIEEAINIFIKLSKQNQNEALEQNRKNHQGFIEQNCTRWKAGLEQLELLFITSQEAAFSFQEHYLSIPELVNDPLLGVLMRLHANALRITSEIIHLIKGGYADGALARWRSLFEIAVTSLIIHKYGKQAAIDYIKHGNIKTVEGIEEYQKTAEKMNLEPYTKYEIEQALALKETLSEGDSYWHWAREYTGFSKLEKLREHVGLGHWSHNYKLASRNIHADYSEMRSLLGMGEATEDLLLVGQSNSGMTLPAHITSIMLNQITSCFLTSYINEKTDLDYTNSMIFMGVLMKYSDNVGEEFLKCQSLKS
jgi:hypothetical protein